MAVPKTSKKNGVEAKKGSKDIVIKAKDAANGRNAPAEASNTASRVIYIGHIPHGFYEDQLLGYFSQFGKVTRVRLSRSKKTAKSKGYAFVEFQHPEVAEIAAETMNGYLMLGQKLQARVLPKAEQHPLLWKGANRKFKRMPWQKLERDRVNRDRTPAEQAKRVAKLVKRDRKREERIKAAGIEYDFKGYAAKLPEKPKKIKFSSLEQD